MFSSVAISRMFCALSAQFTRMAAKCSSRSGMSAARAAKVSSTAWIVLAAQRQQHAAVAKRKQRLLEVVVRRPGKRAADLHAAHAVFADDAAPQCAVGVHDEALAVAPFRGPDDL